MSTSLVTQDPTPAGVPAPARSRRVLAPPVTGQELVLLAVIGLVIAYVLLAFVGRTGSIVSGRSCRACS